jgi:hypothetical protein
MKHWLAKRLCSEFSRLANDAGHPLSNAGGIIALALTVFLASGCALFNGSPNEARAKRAEDAAAVHERERAIDARAKDYERKGLSSREAQALARSEYVPLGAAR